METSVSSAFRWLTDSCDRGDHEGGVTGHVQPGPQLPGPAGAVRRAGARRRAGRAAHPWRAAGEGGRPVLGGPHPLDPFDPLQGHQSGQQPLGGGAIQGHRHLQGGPAGQPAGQGLRGVEGEQLAVVHDPHPVGQGGRLVHVMGGEHDGHPP